MCLKNDVIGRIAKREGHRFFGGLLVLRFFSFSIDGTYVLVMVTGQVLPLALDELRMEVMPRLCLDTLLLSRLIPSTQRFSQQLRKPFVCRIRKKISLLLSHPRNVRNRCSIMYFPKSDIVKGIFSNFRASLWHHHQNGALDVWVVIFFLETDVLGDNQ
jgi:hypothetical protein